MSNYLALQHTEVSNGIPLDKMEMESQDKGSVSEPISHTLSELEMAIGMGDHEGGTTLCCKLCNIGASDH
ncbi:hypothetical protein ANABIO32_43830 [Rossellomorea marisflavi]|nr:hypothetical protein ANABIO32_43830 [Rossellomorea marisflavi]